MFAQEFVKYGKPIVEYLVDGYTGDVNQTINDLGNIIVKTYLGSALNIDPVCAGQAEIANATYFNKVENSITRMKAECSIQEVKNIFEIVKIHEYRIKLLEDKSEAIWEMVEFLSRGESGYSIAGKCLQFGGELLAMSPFAAFAAPVILLGSGIRLWDSSTVDALSERNLAYGRALFVDNVTCNMLHDKVDRALKNQVDAEDRKERFEDWVNQKEQALEEVEGVMIGGDKLYYGINFFDIYDASSFTKKEEFMGVIAPYVFGRKIYMTYAAFDFKQRTSVVKETSFMKNEFPQTIAYLKYELERSGLKLRYVSCTPFTAECKVVRERISKLNIQFMRNLPDDPVSARRLIHQFIQNGADI